MSHAPFPNDMSYPVSLWTGRSHSLCRPSYARLIDEPQTPSRFLKVTVCLWPVKHITWNVDDDSPPISRLRQVHQHLSTAAFSVAAYVIMSACPDPPASITSIYVVYITWDRENVATEISPGRVDSLFEKGPWRPWNSKETDGSDGEYGLLGGPSSVVGDVRLAIFCGRGVLPV